MLLLARIEFVSLLTIGYMSDDGHRDRPAKVYDASTGFQGYVGGQADVAVLVAWQIIIEPIRLQRFKSIAEMKLTQLFLYSRV